MAATRTEHLEAVRVGSLCGSGSARACDDLENEVEPTFEVNSGIVKSIGFA